MKKKILLLISDKNFSFENPHSAVATYLNTLSGALKNKGFTVDTYPPAANQEIKPSNSISPKRRFKLLKKILKNLFPSFYYGLLVKQKIGFSKKLSAILSNNNTKYDLIIEFLTLGSSVGIELKKKNKTPLVIIYDSPLLEQFFDMYGSRSILKNSIKKIEKSSIEGANSIICYSEPVKQYIKQTFNTNAPISILPCIVWKNETAASNLKNPIIGFIGSFLKWHKVELLVKAFENIAQEFPNLTLTLVGKGEEWQKVREYVLKSRFNERIAMPGFVSEEQLEELKKTFLIGVMPGSNWYGSPLKLFEYAQAQIPIIAPETPTIKDLFTTNEVLFIKSGNELKSLENNLVKLLTDEKLRTDLSINAANKMETTYSKSNQIRNFIQITENILNSTG